MTHTQNLNAVTKNAVNAVRNASPMYFVNQLNKAAKKNEFIENVDIRELQKVYCAAFGRDAFALYDFTKGENGAPHVEKTAKKRPAEKYTITDEGENGFKYLCPISPTLAAYLRAFQYICKPYTKGLDKAEKDAQRDAQKAAKDALKAEKKAAQIEYNNGRIDFATYKAIMNK